MIPRKKAIDTKNKSETFLGLNIQSFKLHQVELIVFLGTLEKNSDVNALTETWWKDIDKPDNYDLPGCQIIVSKPRKSARRKSGGVAFYIRDNRQYTIQDTNTEIECSIVQVKYKEKCLHNLCVIYKPPSLSLTGFGPKLGNVLHIFKISKEENLIFADFSINISKWEKITKE